MRDCTCVGSCRGAEGLRVGWNCVVDNGSVEDVKPSVYPTAIHYEPPVNPVEAPIPLSRAMLEAIRTWAADDRLWGSRSATEFNLCTFARVILKAQAEGL